MRPCPTKRPRGARRSRRTNRTATTAYHGPNVMGAKKCLNIHDSHPGQQMKPRPRRGPPACAKKQAAQNTRNSPRSLTSRRARRRSAPLVPRHANARRLLVSRGAHGLADQERRIGVLARHELLRKAAPHLCRVEIAILVDAELMGAPQSSRLWSHGAPRGQQLPGQIEFEILGVQPADSDVRPNQPKTVPSETFKTENDAGAERKASSARSFRHDKRRGDRCRRR